MKVGKIPELVLNRSVFKQIRHRRNEVLVRPGIGKDCGMLQLAEDEMLVLSTDPIIGTVEEISLDAVYTIANDIACSRAEFVGVMVNILLPAYCKEKDLKILIAGLEAQCKELNIEIIGGHTECTNAVNSPVVTITGVGKLQKEKLNCISKVSPGQEIVMTKWAGLEGTAIIANRKEEELRNRFTSDIIDEAKKMKQYYSVLEEAKIVQNLDISALHDVTEGGIFGALWELGAANHVGLSIDLPKIPFRQATIEVSEFYDLNPYLLKSGGSLLLVTPEANHVVEELEKNGIKATVIGRITDGNDRIVINEEEQRYLEPPRADELHKVVN